ncbi:hypothetical protein [Pelagibacterium halotolerans]|uniref:hypothetical protein n=1 Tax=Pelagibacterium halotolerans TaxID=531813 RepID=UPI00384C417D
MSTRRLAFILGGVLFVAVLLGGFGWAVWLAIPEPDTRHSATSPSGERTIHIFEVCFEDSCVHQAVLELPSVEGPIAQLRCGIDITATEPQFEALDVAWGPDENTVDVTYTNADGQSDGFTLDFARDCVG